MFVILLAVAFILIMNIKARHFVTQESQNLMHNSEILCKITVLYCEIRKMR